jgi:hypothetical protein
LAAYDTVPVIPIAIKIGNQIPALLAVVIVLHTLRIQTK